MLTLRCWNHRLPMLIGVAIVTATMTACSTGAGGAAAPLPAPSLSAASSGSASGSAATTPVSTAAGVASQAGAALAVDVNDGLSLTLPLGYVQVTSATTPEDLIRQGVPSGPALASTLTSLQGAIPPAVTIFAVDFTSAATTKFANNVNINVTDAQGAKPSSIRNDYAQAVAALSNINATPSSSATLTVAGIPALRVDYTLAQAANSIEGTQIYFIHADKLVVTTISMAAKTRNEATVDAIIAGLHVR